MELRDYLRVLRKGWALILAFVIIGIAGGIGITVITKKSYQSTAEIFVAASQASDTQQQQAGSSFVINRVQSYVSIANSPGVTHPVITALHLPLTDDSLSGMISASAPLNKVLIDITVTDHDPVLAAKIAQAVAVQFTSYITNTIEPPDPTTHQPTVKLTITKPATVPSSPSSPKKVLNVGLGLILGLIIGIGLAMLREVLDNTVKGAADFEPFNVPVLGNVPLDKRTPKTPVAFRGDPHSSRSESYRQIRTNLQFVDVDNPPRIIAITSAIPGEGKSTTAINLAAALAEAGARVCLVEADLRRPSIAATLGLVADVGYTTVVIGKAPVETVLQNAGRNLAVLTSGPIPPNPSELLLSNHAKQVIFDIAAKVDFTIIDTPPLLPVTDGAELATIADGTIIVHRAGKTTRDQALRSMEALEKVGKKPIGVVLNMITRQGGKYDYEYGYTYAAYRPATDGKRRGKKGVAANEPSVGASFQPEAFTPMTSTPAHETGESVAGSPGPREQTRRSSADPAADSGRGRRRTGRGGRRGRVDDADPVAPAPVPQGPIARNPSGVPIPVSDADGDAVSGALLPPAPPYVPGQTPIFPPPVSEPADADSGNGTAQADLSQPTPMWFRPTEPN